MNDNPPQTTAIPPRLPRRWFRFGLRTLLVVMTMLGGGLAWVANERAKVRTQIEGLRSAEFDLQIFPDERRWAWSRWLWGDVLPRDIFCLDSTNGILTERSLAHLHGLANLRMLMIQHPSFRGAGLENLQGNSDLAILRLECPQWTDDDLVHLERLSQLMSLLLIDTRVTADGIKNLQRALPHCKIEVRPDVPLK